MLAENSDRIPHFSGRADPTNPVHRFAKPTMVLVSVALSIMAAEIAYRAVLYFSGEFVYGYRIGSIVFGTYDEHFGVTYPPNTKFTLFRITDGRVTWCPEAIVVTNADGLVGKTTIGDYSKADIRILTFGDSLTYWNQDGYTWPDLLQENLSRALNANVKVLNYGRGAYGVLQMFDLAASKIKEHEPDLAIIAFITDDLTRSRWWTKAVNVDGYERPLLSPDKHVFDLKIASDEYLVNSLVNLDWCKRCLEWNQRDPALREFDKQYFTIRESTLRARGLTEDSVLATNKCYVLNKIIYGTPFHQRRPVISRVSLEEFEKDPVLAERIATMNNSGVPYLLVHLPLKPEIEKSQLEKTDAERFVGVLERLTNRNVVRLSGYIDNMSRLPGKIDLLPNDPHPNLVGLKLYADLVTSHLVKDGVLGK